MRGSRLTVVVGVCALLTAACGNDRDGSTSSNPATAGDGPSNFDCNGATRTETGHVFIETEADLAQLDGVRVVEGVVEIDKTPFTNLDFMGCVEEVGRGLTIFGNTQLTDVKGLASLQRIEGSFVFSENTAVTDLNAANALAEVTQSVVIHDNEAMTAISGLTSLATIGGAINIRSNDTLENIDGLRSLRTVGGQLAITGNPNLCISSVNQVGVGITDPTEIPDNWSTRSNDEEC